jgi:shikimate 5-dehydrogenase
MTAGLAGQGGAARAVQVAASRPGASEGSLVNTCVVQENRVIQRSARPA